MFIYFSIGNACAVSSMPRFLASGYGLSQSLWFLDKRIAGSGNEMACFVAMCVLGLVYTACYERAELIISVARSGTLVACIFDLYVTTVSEQNCIVGEIKYVLNYNKL